MGNQLVEGLSAITTSSVEATPNILVLQFTIVNAFLVGKPGGPFALVDTGLENSADFQPRAGLARVHARRPSS
jgi:hypothetical protein